MLYLVSLPLYATLQFMAHANIRLFLTDTFAYINLDFKVLGIRMYSQETLYSYERLWLGLEMIITNVVAWEIMLNSIYFKYIFFIA